MDFIRQHDILPPVGAVYPFAKIREACMALDGGKVNGKNSCYGAVTRRKNMKNEVSRDTRRDLPARLEQLKTWFKEADAVLVGAGSGLSAAAGFTYSGERFDRFFSDFGKKYGFHDMYSGGFYPFPSPEEFWAYWSRYIYINRYDQPAGEPYEVLLRLLGDKNYFVLTTNVDHRFQVAGFDRARLFYTQGDYGLFQCSVPCHDRTYDNEAAIREMLAAQKDMKIPSSLIPRCPVCGKPMTVNLRSDDTFVEDAGWHAACERYRAFLRENAHGRILYLELGVGMNTPGIIKYPFWQMTYRNPEARYACINLEAAYAPAEIARRSLCISSDLSVLSGLAR